jgi:hypothetical protein
VPPQSGVSRKAPEIVEADMRRGFQGYLRKNFPSTGSFECSTPKQHWRTTMAAEEKTTSTNL